MASAIVERPGIGVEDVVVAVLTQSSDVAGGTLTYATPVALAGLAKLTVNPNGTVATDWADDGPAVSATTTGKIQVDLEMLDVVPVNFATIFGMKYANGILVDNGLDTSPYLALGYKQWLSGDDDTGNKVYRYVWLLKGVLAKPQEGGATKADTIKYQHMQLKGEFTRLNFNGNWRTMLRTDDPNIGATSNAVADWFHAPVTSETFTFV